MIFNIITFLALGAIILLGALLVYKNIKVYTASVKSEKQSESIFAQTVQLADFKLIQSDEELRIKNKGKNHCTETISFEYFDYIGSVLFNGR